MWSLEDGQGIAASQYPPELRSRSADGNRPDVVPALVIIQVNDFPSIFPPHRIIASAGHLPP